MRSFGDWEQRELRGMGRKPAAITAPAMQSRERKAGKDQQSFAGRGREQHGGVQQPGKACRGACAAVQRVSRPRPAVFCGQIALRKQRAKKLASSKSALTAGAAAAAAKAVRER